MNDTIKLVLKRNAVIIDAIIVMIRSFCAKPKIRAACTPFPGSPKAFAYGQGIYNSQLNQIWDDVFITAVDGNKASFPYWIIIINCSVLFSTV